MVKLKRVKDGLNIHTLNDFDYNWEETEKLLNQYGLRIQDLVAKGQLTPTQYAQLLKEINGLIVKGEITLNDLSPEILEAINNGEGTPFEILSIPRNDSVDETKVSFVETSSNLLDDSKILNNHVLRYGNEGVPETNNTHDVIEFIPVQPGEVITISTHNSVQRAVYYSFTKDYVSESYSEYNVATFTVPTGAYFLSANIQKNFSGQPQINRGSTLAPYEPYKKPKLVGIDVGELPSGIIKPRHIGVDSVQIPHLDFIETSTNLLNKHEIIKGYTLSEGVPVRSSSNGYIENIGVMPNTDYTLSGSSTEVEIFHRVAFYDSDGNWTNDVAGITLDKFTFKTNSDTARISVVLHVSKHDNPQMNLGSELLPYEEYYSFLKGVSVEGNNDGKTDAKSKENFIIDTSIEGIFDNDKVYPDYTNWEQILSHEVYALFDQLQNEYPNVLSKERLSNDPTGLEISKYHFKPKRPNVTKKSKLPKIYITSGTHGYERGAPLSLYLTMKSILEDWESDVLLEALRFNVEIIFIPITNPYGWNVKQRRNENGVDINRNFPEDWVLGDPNASTYGGTHPLSEIEAQNIKKIFDENDDIDIYYDYHNFGASAENYFIWWPTAGGEWNEQMGEALIKKMTRKWKKDFDFIPEDEFIGYTNTMKMGTIHNYANSIGIGINGTFETCTRFLWDTDSVKHDANAVKGSTEALINLLLINLRELTK